MPESYERDLDLNLLRVLVVVADTGSVTAAAKALYLTQPGVSASLRRLHRAVGAPLFVRQGRSLVPNARGRRLVAEARPHLEALFRATRATGGFDPTTSERTIRVGLSGGSEGWLLGGLLRRLRVEAPHMAFIVLPVQFRNVAELLATAQIDLAVTVADELPPGIRREPLFTGDFVALYDPPQLRLPRRLSRERYLALDHVVVSYNGDTRGVVEDQLGVRRRARVSLPSFHSVGSVLDGNALVATVPAMVAAEILGERPQLRTATLPFELGGGTPIELLWRNAVDDDDAMRFVMQHIVDIAHRQAKSTRGTRSLRSSVRRATSETRQK